MAKHGVYATMLSVIAAALALGAAVGTVCAQQPEGSKPAISSAQLRTAYGKLPLSFEANRGQTDGQVQFLARSGGYTLYLTGNEAVLALPASSAAPEGKVGCANGQGTEIVRMKLLGANPSAKANGLDELPGKSNYFIGSDPKHWHTGVPTYARVRYSNVYPGIDLDYHGSESGQLEYDFVVAPGADADAIALNVGADRVSGHERRLRIASNGDLLISAGGREVRFHKPIVYQDVRSEPQNDVTGYETAGSANRAAAHREFREGRFQIDAENRVHFKLGAYDHTRPLIIDPVVVYSTYLGGNTSDNGAWIAVDSQGNAYVTGNTSSTNFPTANAYQGSLSGSGFTDVFVSKLVWSGSALSLAYSTYLGGSGNTNEGWSIAVDSSGNAYVAGQTNSHNFPVLNAYQATFAGKGSNVFVTALNSTGSALLYSTYLGGSGANIANSIAVDSSGNAYVTGETSSATFPTVNAIQTSNLGNVSPYFNAFVSKLNWNGSALSLVYSTYLGGSASDSANAIAIDSAGNAYVIGNATSTNFPTTANALQPSLGGAQDAFVSKLSWNGSALSLAYSSYLGGSGVETGKGIAVDSAANIYVAGFTYSTDFPTVNALDPTYTGNEKAFVAKMVASDSSYSMAFSTYLGGSGGDFALDVALDPSGNIYLTGGTTSTDFPTVDATQENLGAPGATNAFVTKMNSTGTALLFSTYLGGTYNDAHAIAVDGYGNAYVTGLVTYDDFPTVNPFQANLAGKQNAWVAKISPSKIPTLDGNNTFDGNQTVNGNVTATNFYGNGASLTNVTAAALNCAGCVGNAQLGVAYAAGDAKGGNALNSLELGGLLPSAYAMQNASNSFTGDQLIDGNEQVIGNVTATNFNGSQGVLTNVTSAAVAAGQVTVGPTAEATASQAFSSGPLTLSASLFNSSTGAPQQNFFQWQVEPVANTNNTANPTATLNLVYGVAADPAETGFSVNTDGSVNFSASQTFPASALTGSISESQVTGLAASLASATSAATSASETYANSTFVPLIGGTMGGTLNLPALNATGAVSSASVTTGFAATGSLAIGGGTAIVEYYSVTQKITLPAINPSQCATLQTSPLTGFTPGTVDSIALGIPGSLMSVPSGPTPPAPPAPPNGPAPPPPPGPPPVLLHYQAWETSAAASPTITVEVCNMTGPGYSGGASGTIRIDIFKH